MHTAKIMILVLLLLAVSTAVALRLAPDDTTRCSGSNTFHHCAIRSATPRRSCLRKPHAQTQDQEQG
jgi:hypothetical protein